MLKPGGLQSPLKPVERFPLTPVGCESLEMELQFQWLDSCPCRLVLGEIPYQPLLPTCWVLKLLLIRPNICTLKWGWDEFFQFHWSPAFKSLPGPLELSGEKSAFHLQLITPKWTSKIGQMAHILNSCCLPSTIKGIKPEVIFSDSNMWLEEYHSKYLH